MKKLLFLILILLCSCKNSEKEEKVEKRQFSEIQNQIKKYQEDSREYRKKQDNINAQKYNDSISYLVLNSYVGNHIFNTIDDSIYSTSNLKKPLFLQVTASWCAPCKFQVPALNRIVEKYNDKVDFVLLFGNIKPELEKLVNDYNQNIVLVPCIELPDKFMSVNFSGFSHNLGYPTHYLITTDNKIINFSEGAAMPSSFIAPDGKDFSMTEEEAYKRNYDRLEAEIKELIEKNIANIL